VIAMQMKNALIALSLALLLLVSCAPKAKETPQQVVPVQEPPKAVGVATEQVVTDIGSSVSEVDTLEAELDTSSLDELDADLAELDKLDFG